MVLLFHAIVAPGFILMELPTSILITLAASISIPPVLVLTLTASAPVPVELRSTDTSNAPACAMVRSCASAVAVFVISNVFAASMFNPVPAFISTPPAVAFSLIASVPVPSDLRINEASNAPA